MPNEYPTNADYERYFEIRREMREKELREARNDLELAEYRLERAQQSVDAIRKIVSSLERSFNDEYSNKEE